jgi:PAS domain S-box-containing protein
VNQSVANLFGKSIEELESLHNADVHNNREELDAYDSVEKEVLRTRKSISVEEKFTNSKGEKRTFYTVKTPLVRPSGEVDILGISNDITELRESQIDLLRQEREYRGILESLRVVVGTLDQHMRFNYFNPALVGYLKFSKLEHILHLPVSKIIHKDDFDVFKADFNEVLNHKARLREGRIRITKGKDVFWFNYALTDRGRAGDKKEVLISLYDISEQVQFSRELQRSERIFRAIAVNSADIIGLHGPMGHLKYVSPAVETILGYSQEGLLGLQALNLVHPDDRQRIRSLVTGVKDVSHANRFVQIRVKSKNGEYLWMEITMSFIESESGEPLTIQTASRDITERKKIEEERKRNMDREAELNEFQRSFVMMSSHQLRTPLTVIKSDVDLLRLMYEDENAFDKNRMIRIADRMKTSVSRMTYLMEDILTLGKLDAGAIEKHITSVELLESLDELIQNQFTPLATGRMIVVEFETDEIQIETDLDLLNQAIANFITNADKYSEGEDAPVLTVKKEPGFALVEIKDFGIGIPKSDLAKLYHPFFRGSNAKDYRGTGLGLRIAKNFLDMIDAQVSINSVENEGTTVVIKIPIA